jgi:hypothetical protein
MFRTLASIGSSRVKRALAAVGQGVLPDVTSSAYFSLRIAVVEMTLDAAIHDKSRPRPLFARRAENKKLSGYLQVGLKLCRYSPASDFGASKVRIWRAWTFEGS